MTGDGRPLDTTIDLLTRLRDGDAHARDRLLERYLPILRRWAHGRIPPQARDLAETDDLVQVTLIRTLGRLDQFEYRREGAFLAYLRQVLLSALKDEARRRSRRPGEVSLEEGMSGEPGSPPGIDAQKLRQYESALARLPELQREAVLLRVEFGYSFQEVADAIGSPSANAARMMVSRALSDLARDMSREA